MKHVVSVSLGNSSRDHCLQLNVLGEDYLIERIGTNGDFNKAIDLINNLDGKVDALGMGGIDFYIWGGGKRYAIKDAMKLKKAAKKTPIVDGSGLKNTLERNVIKYLADKNHVDFKGKRILLTSAMDRFGMADELTKYGGKLIIGDLMFSLGLNIPLHSLKTLNRIANIVAPIICRLPFKYLYPLGDRQNYSIKDKKLEKHYKEVDIIAGDFHYIKKYMPKEIKGGIVITNTITQKDLELLKEKGLHMLITTTPELNGRSFGTNVIEALLISIIKNRKLMPDEAAYHEIIKEMSMEPRIEILNDPSKQLYP